jgi:hypothetical protein
MHILDPTLPGFQVGYTASFAVYRADERIRKLRSARSSLHGPVSEADTVVNRGSQARTAKRFRRRYTPVLTDWTRR